MTESEFFLILLSSRLRLTMLDRETEVYRFTMIFQIPDAVVWPITSEIAEGERVELIKENNVLSLAFHCKKIGLIS